ncbi:MAG: hypothetical protein NVSMB52_17430 [Chloroflexota bacterium]
MNDIRQHVISRKLIGAIGFALALSVGIGVFMVHAQSRPDGASGIYVTKRASAPLFTMSATVPVYQKVKQQAIFQIHVRTSWFSDDPVLVFEGIHRWKIVGNAFGGCIRGGDDAGVFLEYDQASRRSLVYVTGKDCTVALRVIPQKTGSQHVSIRVFSRSTIGPPVSQKGLDPATELRGATLRWDITIVG